MVKELELIELERLDKSRTQGEWVTGDSVEGPLCDVAARREDGLRPWQIAKMSAGVNSAGPWDDQLINRDFVIAAANAMKNLISAIRERDAIIHIMTQDGTPALDLGKQIGRGECLAAFDGIASKLDSTPFISAAVLVNIRKAMLESGESIRIPPDQLRDEFIQLIEDIREVVQRSIVRPVTKQIMAEDLLLVLAGKGEDK